MGAYPATCHKNRDRSNIYSAYGDARQFRGSCLGVTPNRSPHEGCAAVSSKAAAEYIPRAMARAVINVEPGRTREHRSGDGNRSCAIGD
jgi:hypothetical protein